MTRAYREITYTAPLIPASCSGDRIKSLAAHPRARARMPAEYGLTALRSGGKLGVSKKLHLHPEERYSFVLRDTRQKWCALRVKK
jgi:hypothetical protein